jgi:trehalose synthase
MVLPLVPVQPKELGDYVEAAGEAVVEQLKEAAEPLRGARVLHLNSTAYGGGVAELLHTQVPLMNALGLEATWALLEGSDDYFAVTKAVHNALQGAEAPLSIEMQKVYLDRIEANAEEFVDHYDFVLVHDPQPAALLPSVQRKSGRSGKWIWRCHIDLSAPFRPVWEFFEQIVNQYDAAVFTMPEFAQPGVAGPRLAFVPPSIDPLALKNAPLSEETSVQVVHGLSVDPDRPIVCQVSRFDPWKDPLGVIDAFRLARREVEGLQLVLVGSLAHDDPEGMQYLDLTNAHRDGDPDIHLLTNLDGVDDLAVNALQRVATVAVQKSTREGFGLVVAEAMWKEKPVIGGAVGGIRLQIEDGETGFLVDSAFSCAERIVELVHNEETRTRMGREGRERVRQMFLTPRELEDYLRLMTALAET